jgi:pimeloyl-ACP methyl ester carboxylesterase
LQPRSTTFSSRRANAPTLHILSWGDERRPKLILLHGGGSNAHWWDHIAPHLAERYCVIALDFRGHGISEYPEELVVGAFNDDLELLLEQIASDEVILIGHSMGCHVAVDHASRHPATRALALIDISRGSTKSARRRSRLALRMRGSYARRQDAIDRFQFMPEAAHASEALRLEIAKNSVRKEDDGRFSFCFDPRWFTLAVRPPPDYSKIACPTLILRGSQSTILSENGANDFAAELADGRLQVIQNAGHHVHIDQPEATLSALREFLDSLGV